MAMTFAIGLAGLAVPLLIGGVVFDLDGLLVAALGCVSVAAGLVVGQR